MSQATLSLYQELAFGRDCESSKDAPLKFNSHLRQTCACTSHRPALWFARNCFAPLPALCRERPHSEDQLPPTAGFARVEQQPVPVAVAGLSCQASSNRGPVAGGLGRKIAISEKYSLVCRSPTAELLKRRPPGHQKSEGYQAIARLMRACVKIGDPKKNDCPLASLKQKKHKLTQNLEVLCSCNRQRPMKSVHMLKLFALSLQLSKEDMSLPDLSSCSVILCETQ